MTQTATIQNLRAAPEAQMPIVAPGFGSLQGFELMQRAARLLSSSTLVPVAYRQTIEKLDRFGNVKESRENPNALANSVVALNMAQRMGADPLMVMQNLYIVEGRPSWSSQWIIAAINGCGRFSPLRFRIESRGEREVEYKSTYWENSQRHTKVEKVKINDKVCVAWAIEKETGEVIESPAVSIEMAVLEGWYTKNGSKWQTMDEVMLRYRTASFFGKLYAPELLMGLQTVEEAQDIIEATTGPDGTISVNVDDLRGGAAQPQRQPVAADVTDVEARDSKAAQGAQPEAPEAEVDGARQDASSVSPEESDLPHTSHDDDGGESLDPVKVEEQLRAAKTVDVLDVAADYLPGITNDDERHRLTKLYRQLRLSLTNAQQRAPRRRVAAPE
jgi:hypothetical protein